MKLQNIINACLIATLLIMSACNNPCKDVNCFNGNCDDGTCICDEGYLQDIDGLCKIGRNTLFEGTYATSTTCQGSGTTLQDTLLVEVATDPNEVYIRSFGGVANNDILSHINGSDVLNITQQTTLAGNVYSGNGTRSGSVLSFTLYTDTDTCQVTMTKQ
jgi:hypothetical protein